MHPPLVHPAAVVRASKGTAMDLPETEAKVPVDLAGREDQVGKKDPVGKKVQADRKGLPVKVVLQGKMGAEVAPKQCCNRLCHSMQTAMEH